MQQMQKLLVFLVLGIAQWNIQPAHAEDLISAIDSYIAAENTNDPVDVTSVVARFVPIGEKEADVTSALQADSFELVRNQSDRYYWNIDDPTGSQHYLGFEQVRNKLIISTRTYIIEVGIRNGAVCWEHAGVVGQTL